MERSIMHEHRPNGELWLSAFQDNEEIGYLILSPKDALDGQFGTDAVMVEKPFQRQGVGRELMRAAEKLLGYLPSPERILNDTCAKAFWKAHGFNSGFHQTTPLN